MRTSAMRLGGPHPYVLVLLVAAICAAALVGFQQIAHQRDQSRFANAIEVTQDAIRSRFDAYASILFAARGLYVSHEGNVDLSTFRSFVRELRIDERYPGIQGVGFSRRLLPAEIESVVAEVQRQGQIPFRVWPEHPRDEFHSIVFLEPLDRRNAAAIGYDMFSEPTRREAMERARDSGAPAASGRVVLVQEIDPAKQAGFLIYVPVYRGGIDPGEVEGRRAALLGFVYSPFRVDDLLQGIFGTQREPRISFDLYDGTMLGAEHRMHRGIDHDREPRLRQRVELMVAGRTWTLDVVSSKAFEAGSSGRLLPYFVLIGIALNLGFVFAARAQVRARKDEARARERLAILADTTKQLTETKLEVDAVLTTICREVVQRLADMCVINFVDDGRTLRLAHLEHRHEAIANELRDAIRAAPIQVGEGFTGKVAVSGEPMLLANLDKKALLANVKPEHRKLIDRVDVRSLVIVPMRVGDQITGTIAVARDGDQPAFAAADQQLLQDIADRTAFAVENARLAEQLRRSMQDAQQAVRVRDDFLSIAGHELKTPLAALQLQVEGLLRHSQKHATDARVAERLGKAQRQVQRLEVLIEGLLDVSRIAAGKLALQHDELELHALISEVVERFTDTAGHADCAISLRAPEPIVGTWDRVRLDQVFTNLIGNALKYGGGKPIEIDLVREADRAKIAVRDHGIGIPAEARDRIFERFERAVSERNYGGLGLGLWITQQIVEASGGRISVESEVGAGSTFTVELPIRKE